MPPRAAPRHTKRWLALICLSRVVEQCNARFHARRSAFPGTHRATTASFTEMGYSAAANKRQSPEKLMDFYIFSATYEKNGEVAKRFKKRFYFRTGLATAALLRCAAESETAVF